MRAIGGMEEMVRRAYLSQSAHTLHDTIVFGQRWLHSYCVGEIVRLYWPSASMGAKNVAEYAAWSSAWGYAKFYGSIQLHKMDR